MKRVELWLNYVAMISFIDRSEIWFGDKPFGWTNLNLKEVFREVKKDKQVEEIDLVLGSEMSYLVAVKIDESEKIDREKSLKIAEANLPFVPVSEGFDWQIISLGEGDNWLQIAAIEPGFLDVLMKAAKATGIRIRRTVPVATLLAARSKTSDAPVLIKWIGKERVSVLAIKGLVDYMGNEEDEKINAYARRKWHLAVNPEQIVLDERDFDFVRELENIDTKGSDAEVMNIDLIRRGITVEIAPMSGFGGSRMRKLLLVMIMVVFLFTLGIVAYQRRSLPQPETPEVIEIPPVSEPIESTQSAQREMNTYSINVLNGSGITGEAAKVKKELEILGFSEVEIGNTTPKVRTTIAYKADVPAEILSVIVESLSEYEIENLFDLTNEKEFDVEVVIGSVRKE